MNQSGISQCPHSGLAVVDQSAYDSLPSELASQCSLPGIVITNHKLYDQLPDECSTCICNDTCISMNKEALDKMLTSQEFQIGYNGSTFKTPLQSWGYMYTNLQSSNLSNIILVPEPDNQLDNMAVLVKSDNKPVGYIPKGIAEKPALFQWLQAGNTAQIIAAIQMANDAQDTPKPANQLELQFNTIPLATLDTTQATIPVTTNHNSNNKPAICAYKFTGFTFLKPNRNKAGSDKWSKNWIGYVSLKGEYWESKLGKQTRPFAGIQVTVNRNTDGSLVASQYSGSGEYRYNGIISPAIGGKFHFLRGVNFYINNVGFDELVENQLKSTGNLFMDYNVEKKVSIR